MKYSIITINRNNAAGLGQTISSVLAQSCTDYEYIIVDGASTDTSVDVIVELCSGRANVRWVSEPDSGIYNAMNKGVAMACGEYVLFLNSGDTFAGNEVMSAMDSETGVEEIVIGRVNVVKEGKIVSTSPVLSNDDLTLYNIYLRGIPHQAAFIKRDLLVRCPYDESLKINSDWKFFVQEIVLDGVSVKTVPVIIADYDGEGISSTNMDMLLAEREKVFREIVPARIAADYLAVAPHYYEVVRVKWLLAHPLFYKVYRMWSSLGLKLSKQTDERTDQVS